MGRPEPGMRRWLTWPRAWKSGGPARGCDSGVSTFRKRGLAAPGSGRVSSWS
ncbi:uncharacterized protein BKA78DRAFT_325620 [Phyllosticta capitalensis]|uniref:uncharacterized protein n=1 Tax=Phyllosticta capitalensis TaxID=121624 RepID=UPI00312D3E34